MPSKNEPTGESSKDSSSRRAASPEVVKTVADEMREYFKAVGHQHLAPGNWIEGVSPESERPESMKKK